jgi:hypothetical protein
MDTLRNGAMVCVACGTVARPVSGPAPAPHHARAECSGCGRWLAWLPQARKAEPFAIQGARRIAMDAVNYLVVSGTIDRAPSVRFREDGVCANPSNSRL